MFKQKCSHQIFPVLYISDLLLFKHIYIFFISPEYIYRIYIYQNNWHLISPTLTGGGRGLPEAGVRRGAGEAPPLCRPAGERGQVGPARWGAYDTKCKFKKKFKWKCVVVCFFFIRKYVIFKWDCVILKWEKKKFLTRVFFFYLIFNQVNFFFKIILVE